jgi:hypothetical protein
VHINYRIGALPSRHDNGYGVNPAIIGTMTHLAEELGERVHGVHEPGQEEDGPNGQELVVLRRDKEPAAEDPINM